MIKIPSHRKFLYQIFFLLILVFPNSFREIKLPIALIIFLLAISDRVFLKNIDGKFLFILVAHLFSMSAFIFYGSFNYVDGSLLYLVATYLVGPIFWTFFLCHYLKEFGLKSLLMTLMLGGILASFLIILYYYYFNDIPESLKEILVSEPNVTLTDGVPVSRLHTVSTLVFIVPAFFFSTKYLRAYVQKNNRHILYRILLVAVTSMLLIVASILSGRTALILILIISILYATAQLNIKNIAIAIILFIASIWILIFLNIDLQMIIQFIIEKIQSYGGEERLVQRSDLLVRFWQSPIFGEGHGVQAGVIRSDEQPWRYELFYHALLFHVGIVGSIMYFLPIIFSLWRVKQILASNRAYLLFVISGCFGILFASYTNPYIEGVESQWMLTLTWAIALAGKRGSSSEITYLSR